jgi:hypothetical protein
VKDFNTDPEVVLFCLFFSCIIYFTSPDFWFDICTEKNIFPLFSRSGLWLCHWKQVILVSTWLLLAT